MEPTKNLASKQTISFANRKSSGQPGQDLDGQLGQDHNGRACQTSSGYNIGETVYNKPGVTRHRNFLYGILYMSLPACRASLLLCHCHNVYEQVYEYHVHIIYMLHWFS